MIGYTYGRITPKKAWQDKAFRAHFAYMVVAAGVFCRDKSFASRQADEMRINDMKKIRTLHKRFEKSRSCAAGTFPGFGDFSPTSRSKILACG
ncbi:MAG: hypothetical protein J5878_06730 [Oscillospiraceae bacterium]|nr:hypothetical protein [Oscillospiraceae bacterium]